MKRYPYFDHDMGLGCHAADITGQIAVIANRYIGENPPLPYTARAMAGDFFRQNADGAYLIDLTEKLGAGANGYAMVAGVLHSEGTKTVGIDITCLGPVSAWLNGEPLFSSTFADEIRVGYRHGLTAVLREGANTLLFLLRRTVAGFGCMVSLPHITVCAPFCERKGMAGWVWTDLLEKVTEPQVQAILKSIGKQDNQSDLAPMCWYPLLEGESAATAQMALFPQKQGYCVSWSRIGSSTAEGVSLKLNGLGRNDIYCNGQCLGTYEQGEHTLVLKMHQPMHIHVVSHMEENKPFGALLLVEGGEWVMPTPCLGQRDPWLYAGVFPEEMPFEYRQFVSPEAADWRLAGNNLYLRLFFEGAYSDIWWVRQGGSAFGSWNYPLGVTLQGLLRAGDTTGNQEIIAYVQAHMRQCLSHYAYTMRDTERYGFPSINPYLVRQASLDDFGSMASAMLECHKRCKTEEAVRLSEGFFAFIAQKLPQLSNGAFYRKTDNPTGTDTLWADDLYMGTSFLSRYYELTKDQRALDLAVTQFLAYNEYLALPEYGIFSHVYDVSRKLKTGIPWGRGNGWSLFSLADLLGVTPLNHPRYGELMALFQCLSQGYAALQDERGFWHQILTDHESYEEASCTAMFTYAMSKGLRMGWYDEAEKYRAAVHKGWKALSTYAIDKAGNVHAVCKGSGFSFTKEYYADELFWIVNDNHGVGIVLLAASEYWRMLNM